MAAAAAAPGARPSGASRRDAASSRFRQFPDIFPETMHGDGAVPVARNHALTAYRRRMKRRGVVRLEVHVRKADAALIRGIVEALADPEQEVEARALLRERFNRGTRKGLKALLAAAPLEGIELGRGRDFGRDVEL
jgi:hypothetical protein